MRSLLHALECNEAEDADTNGAADDDQGDVKAVHARLELDGFVSLSVQTERHLVGGIVEGRHEVGRERETENDVSD